MQAPNQVLYGFRLKKTFDLMRFGDTKTETNAVTVSFILIEVPSVPMENYRPNHINAKNAIIFDAINMKKYYDSKH